MAVVLTYRPLENLLTATKAEKDRCEGAIARLAEDERTARARLEYDLKIITSIYTDLCIKLESRNRAAWSMKLKDAHINR